jgi:hypothetical protein
VDDPAVIDAMRGAVARIEVRPSVNKHSRCKHDSDAS